MLLCCLAIGGVQAEVVDIRQGTNMALAVSPDGETLVVDLLGGLWRMPVTGGGATPLIPAASGVAQPRFSPDGGRIAFQRWLDGQWDLWQLNLASGEYAALTSSEYNEREPDYSPDGSQIVFAGDRSGNYAIWSLDLASGALRQLTDEPGDSRFPTYSDSGDLAYVHRIGTRSELEISRGGPRGSALFSSERWLDAPSWRPGSGVVVYNERVEGASSDLAMYVDADEAIRRRLTTAEDVFVGRIAWLSPAEYLYAADGQIWRRKLASSERTPVHMFAGASIESLADSPRDRPFDRPGPHPAVGINGLTRDKTAGRAAFSALGDLWLVDGKTVRQLTDDAATDAWPDFSPDGEWLFFASDRGGNMQVWRLRIDSGQLLQVSSEPGRVFLPRVSPDGRYVAFLETAGYGPWDEASLKLIAIDEPFRSTTVAAGLFDASDLTWQGSRLRLLARDVQGLKALARVFATPAADIERELPEPVEPLSLPAAAMPSFKSASADAPYVIQAGRLFDGINNRYTYLVDIHVEGQRITQIVRRGQLPLPDRVIDANRMTIVPGLIDVHAHMSAVGGSAVGRAWLANGVTTVREVMAEAHEATERAEIWASGRQPGPRLVISPLQPPTDLQLPESSPVVLGGGRVARGLSHELAEQLVREDETMTRLPPVLAPGAGTNSPGLTLSTLGRSYQDVISSLGATGAWLPTGLAALELAHPAPGSDSMASAITRVMRSSGRVAIGSDAPAVPYGSGYHDELAALAEQGIPTDQILRWATAGGAIALGLSLETGTLEPGRLADLLVIDGDPLAKLTDLRRIVAVVRGGVWIDRESLN